MPLRRPRLTFITADPQAFMDLALLHGDDWTLGRLLEEMPGLSRTPLDPDYLKVRLSSLSVSAEDAADGAPLYLPPELAVGSLLRTAGQAPAPDAAGRPAGQDQEPPPGSLAGAQQRGGGQRGRDNSGRDNRELADAAGHPENLSERAAVLIAHQEAIERAGAYLKYGLSVLIQCEKLLVEHLIDEIVYQSGRTRTVVRAEAESEAPAGLPPAGRRSSILAALEREVNDTDEDRIVVVPHLDLLAGGASATISSEARELTDVLYDRSERVLLAFTDPSLVLPEVLANRFAVRLAMDVLPRDVLAAGGRRVPVGQALVRREEAGLFQDFDAIALYKNIAGMNAVRLRHAMRFAFYEHHDYERRQRKVPAFADLLQELAVFKARTSKSFEVPNVSFEMIGGYQSVKAELDRALKILSGAAAGLSDVPEQVRQDLIPRGFMFHGPPGTGKTLFAKAIATELDATILVVSGPEVTDMYVGESERKVRELFAEARRNAPSVLVFDEFDSIAGRRSGREDSGSRAGNAVVAQLLTEMDGFRPEVPVLVIGTTNRIDIIDDALLRPSRFRAIRIDLPDEEARQDIARVHARAFLREQPSDELLQAIARATDGMNGDEIRSVFRDARADELLDGPDATPGAYRFGELIGALRRAQQQRENAQSRRPAHPSPGTAYIPLRPAAAQPAAAAPRPITAEFTIPRATQEDS